MADSIFAFSLFWFSIYDWLDILNSVVVAVVLWLFRLCLFGPASYYLSLSVLPKSRVGLQIEYLSMVSISFGAETWALAGGLFGLFD